MITYLMNDLAEWGTYEVPPEMLMEIRKVFATGWADEDQVREMIADCWDRNHYVIDPHTACGYFVMQQMPADPQVPRVLLSTASPVQVPARVNEALGLKADGTDFECMDELHAKSGTPIPQMLRNLENAEVRFRDCVEVSDMGHYVEECADRL